ncbi:Microcystin LR degradation protein MlrC [Beutenbergia cavernae DSM 12333]|uniref:Microcystin LR degradation protein MlrC n=1 Tax=Beutenbergia cavernae (strain ATCC BAA-8 / DSM 12333 / CCUG 43141 / JCM 11478 / NBRC 16432 / NCIMB 13614 / HKI 0122) TaxID=471853 RepID=C5C2N1_BEUC1|nr:M81 family metallopeptidase [Beutenbergia cavernae]ACQ79717.1 Microcystin LR degradation protein MlrC [Beutenbergia cavernae DSM 12333]
MTPRPRVGVLGFFHESNTFAPTRVTATMVRDAELRGESLRHAHGGAGTVIAGYLDAADALDWDVLPLLYCELVPCGPLLPEARERVLSELIGAARAALADGGLDALLVCVHGAAVSTDSHDLDGEILEELRDAVGRDVLIAVTLDLHANVSDRMVDAVDVVVGYRTNPHVDARQRAMDATRIVAGCLDGAPRPVTLDVPVPATVSILAQGTNDEPMRSLMAAVERIAALDGVLDASLFEGFPWSDTSDVGMRVVLLTEPGFGDGPALAAGLAQRVWDERGGFLASAPTAAEALADLPADGTTLLLDVGDNVGGGGTGDNTALLAASIHAGVTSTLGVVLDPDAAAAAAATGVGNSLEVDLGAPALRVEATVLALSDGTYEDTGPTHVGHRYFDAGPSAALWLATGQTVVVCSRRVMPSSVRQLENLGLRIRDFRAVLAKGVHSPLAGYSSHVDAVVQVDTPGVTRNDLTRLSYRQRPRPLFPFDPFDAEPELQPRRIS